MEIQYKYCLYLQNGRIFLPIDFYALVKGSLETYHYAEKLKHLRMCNLRLLVSSCYLQIS